MRRKVHFRKFAGWRKKAAKQSDPREAKATAGCPIVAEAAKQSPCGAPHLHHDRDLFFKELKNMGREQWNAFHKLFGCSGLRR
jgi:hypothetical protein